MRKWDVLLKLKSGQKIIEEKNESRLSWTRGTFLHRDRGHPQNDVTLLQDFGPKRRT